MSQTQLKRAEAPALLTTKEASDALRISRWKLYDLIRRRKLETVKIGRRTLVPADALARLVSQLRGEDD